MKRATAVFTVLLVFVSALCGCVPTEQSSQIVSVTPSDDRPVYSAASSMESAVIPPAVSQESSQPQPVSDETSPSSEPASSQPTPDSQPLLPQSLLINVSKILLGEGQSFKITSAVYPSDALGAQLVWSSNDSSIAAVSVDTDGVVSYVSPGSAIITCSTVLGDLFASCTVTCIDVCTDTEQLEKVLQNAILSDCDSITVNVESEDIVQQLEQPDMSIGSFIQTGGDTISFTVDGETRSVYAASFDVEPAFAKVCSSAISSGNFTDCTQLHLQACQAALRFADELDSQLSDYRKIKEIHDYIIGRKALTMSHGGTDEVYSAHTAFGALCDNIATEDGITDAFNLLAATCGFEARTVKGIRNGQRYIWNTVKLDGRWYHVDLVADSAVQPIGYEYFLVSDLTMRENCSFPPQGLIEAPLDYTGPID